MPCKSNLTQELPLPKAGSIAHPIPLKMAKNCLQTWWIGLYANIFLFIYPLLLAMNAPSLDGIGPMLADPNVGLMSYIWRFVLNIYIHVQPTLSWTTSFYRDNTGLSRKVMSWHKSSCLHRFDSQVEHVLQFTSGQRIPVKYDHVCYS